MNWAHLHLMLNHIPVLGAFLITISLTLATYRRNETITLLCLQIIVVIGIFTLGAYFTGEPSEDAIEHLPGVTEAFINAHEKAALYGLVATELLAILSLLGLFVFRRGLKSPTSLLKPLFLLSLVNIGVMTWTANLGGLIPHTELRVSVPNGD